VAADPLPLNIVIAGHVDHGKSTLIGRLLHETGSLPDGKVEELIATSARRGVSIEWSFVLDALQAERDQAITIDTTRVWFSANGRRYAIIDAPGHRQFIGNMMSGAAEADAAILMVDVTEGVSEQTRRHAYLLQLLGIDQIVVAVNKMDIIAYDRSRFEEAANACRTHLTHLGLTPAAIVPVSARDGENLVARSNEALAWYTGPTILEALEALVPATSRSSAPLRMRVQDVYRIDDRRISVGQIAAGTLRVGDAILVSPTGSSAHVTSIDRWPENGPPVAHAGESIGFTLDQPIYVDRGDVISHQTDAPQRVSTFGATFFWLAETGPQPDDVFALQFGPTQARVTIESIDRVTDTQSLATLPDTSVPQYAVIEVKMRSSALLALDTRETNSLTARCVLLRGNEVVAGGLITRAGARAARSANIHPLDHLVSREERAQRYGHGGAVIWLTGLSGSGKSTIAMAVERHLFTRGRFVYVLDGDNIRSGLNRDLGFSPDDRTENIRRVGEVAALFAQAGALVITAFISPSAEDRAAARAAAAGAFYEVHIAADLQTCEGRDAKGLYARARSGEIPEFTGISAPYDAPEAADLTIDTARLSVDASVEMLVDFIVRNTAAPAGVV
jgi:bifunctional enzyme CysN/CysC